MPTEDLGGVSTRGAQIVANRDEMAINIARKSRMPHASGEVVANPRRCFPAALRGKSGDTNVEEEARFPSPKLVGQSSRRAFVGWDCEINVTQTARGLRTSSVCTRLLKLERGTPTRRREVETTLCRSLKVLNVWQGSLGLTSLPGPLLCLAICLVCLVCLAAKRPDLAAPCALVGPLSRRSSKIPEWGLEGLVRARQRVPSFASLTGQYQRVSSV
ncbi:hypothetical protein GQ53DRAFT_547662 [Thozetella sp. PMI_491]|nr:hypothetical protein GQ53DRAFT_547662 [Thozetella sp. PMI_491]